MNTSYYKQLSLAVAICSALGTGAANATTYYVAKNGNDANSGTEAQPWLSIQKAADTMVAGDKVYIKAGIYSESTLAPPTYYTFAAIKPKRGGTADKPIVYEAYPGDTVVIDQRGSAMGFYVAYSYITIKGFEIRNAWQGGIFANNGVTGVVADGNYIHDIDGPAGNNVGGVRFDSCHYCTVSNNKIHTIKISGTTNNQNCGGIYSYGWDHANVYGNEVWNTYNGVFHKQSNGLKGMDVHDNYFHDVNYGIRYSVQAGGDPPHVDQTVYRNVIAAGTAVYASTDDTGSASHGLDIYNNVFVTTDQTLNIHSFTGVRIWNNIFYSGGSNPAIATHTGRWGIRIDRADYNLYYSRLNNVLDMYGGNQATYSSLPAWQSASHPHLAVKPGQHSLVADPGFVDAAVQDYRLKPDSVAIGKGLNGEDLGAYPVPVPEPTPPSAPTGLRVQ